MTPAKRHSYLQWRAEKETNHIRKFKNTPAWRQLELFDLAVILAKFLLICCGLYHRGKKNARDLQVRYLDTQFSQLPSQFNGWQIMHLSDFHFHADRKAYAHQLAQQIAGIKTDLCVITGDFGSGYCKGQRIHTHILPSLNIVLNAITAKEGIIAVLGNHDSSELVEFLEARGITVLINESITFSRNKQSLQIIGTDDVYRFHSPEVDNCLKKAHDNFTIALIHSPEIYDTAANSGVDFYLCGHTHGGQITLPFKIPIITHVKRGRKYFQGFWQVGKMQGYTNSGVGTSGIDQRYNTKPEVVIHKLSCK